MTRSIPARTVLFVSCLFLLLLQAPLNVQGQDALPPFDAAAAPPAPDYALASSWLAKPAKGADQPVDVFWVYPTVLLQPSGWLQDVADEDLRRRARWTITTQASALAAKARLYAPLYRQANVAVLGLDAAASEQVMAAGKDDVWRAFQYYLKHENQGRPFIIAGHSQGSNLLLELLLEHWGSTGAESRLVAGYLIGWSITHEDLQANRALEICRSRQQTGCFITYNSVAPGRQKAAPTIRPGAVVVNPLSWRTDGEMVPAAHNTGAVFFDESGQRTLLPQFTSAQAVDGGLVVRPKRPEMLGSKGLFPEGVYHKDDYSLFYENLRENAEERSAAFLDAN